MKEGYNGSSFAVAFCALRKGFGDDEEHGCNVYITTFGEGF